MTMKTSKCPKSSHNVAVHRRTSETWTTKPILLVPLLVLGLAVTTDGLQCYWCLPCSSTPTKDLTCGPGEVCSYLSGYDPVGDFKEGMRCVQPTGGVMGQCYRSSSYDVYTNVEICLCDKDFCNYNKSTAVNSAATTTQPTTAAPTTTTTPTTKTTATTTTAATTVTATTATATTATATTITTQTTKSTVTPLGATNPGASIPIGMTLPPGMTSKSGASPPIGMTLLVGMTTLSGLVPPSTGANPPSGAANTPGVSFLPTNFYFSSGPGGSAQAPNTTILGLNQPTTTTTNSTSVSGQDSSTQSAGNQLWSRDRCVLTIFTFLGMIVGFALSS